jgi:hypothetical protein
MNNLFPCFGRAKRRFQVKFNPQWMRIYLIYKNNSDLLYVKEGVRCFDKMSLISDGNSKLNPLFGSKIILHAEENQGRVGPG